MNSSFNPAAPAVAENMPTVKVCIDCFHAVVTALQPVSLGVGVALLLKYHFGNGIDLSTVPARPLALDAASRARTILDGMSGLSREQVLEAAADIFSVASWPATVMGGQAQA